MHVKTANDHTSELVVRPGDDDDPPDIDEPYRVEFSENNIARVSAEVGKYLAESDDYDVTEHTQGGGSGGED